MSLFSYTVYGVSLRSEFPLLLPERSQVGQAEIEIRIGSPKNFSEAINRVELPNSEDWYHHTALSDGSHYVRWQNLGEFLVSADGSRILCAPAAAADIESFQVYLLNQAISFALVQQGLEPLHATTVIVDGGAVAFLGGSGFGKSTLAASFLQAGHGLLTDDLLVVRRGKQGVVGYPGPRRIKLFPKIARRFLGEDAGGVPMNELTQKRVIALREESLEPVPLRSIYALAPPKEARRQRRIQIEVMNPRQAFLALVANTSNYRIVHSQRLRRQVSEIAHLLCSIPIQKLTYPRSLTSLEEVRDVILADTVANKWSSA